MHILPRHKNDLTKEQVYEKLRTHDLDLKTGIRTVEEMATEAILLRKLFY
jgi:hypothetical protein